jgi:hypothetical protein
MVPSGWCTHLWCHVERRPGCCVPCSSGSIQHFSQPKVRDLETVGAAVTGLPGAGLPDPLDQHIDRLQIPVDDTVGVQVASAREELHHIAGAKATVAHTCTVTHARGGFQRGADGRAPIPTSGAARQ